MFAVRPITRTATTTSTTSFLLRPAGNLNLNLTQRPLWKPRTMTSSSASAPLQEWLIIVPDNVGALQKRVEARPKHLEGIKSDREDMWLWGGAMLEEPFQEGIDAGPPKMKGSAMLVGAKSKEEVLERLKKDVYVEKGVWDLSQVQIIPFRSALRKAL